MLCKIQTPLHSEPMPRLTPRTPNARFPAGGARDAWARGGLRQRAPESLVSTCSICCRLLNLLVLYTGFESAHARPGPFPDRVTACKWCRNHIVRASSTGSVAARMPETASWTAVRRRNCVKCLLRRPRNCVEMQASNVS